MAIASATSDYMETIVVDSRERIGLETSSRNSGVIHSGIYYKTGSLKHQHCVRGCNLLYEYCQRNSITHKQTGKLIVATLKYQKEKLEQLYINGINNGVEGLEQLSKSKIERLEPELSACGAIYSKTTGIVDVNELIYSFNAKFDQNEGILSLSSCVLSIDFDGTNFITSVMLQDKSVLLIKSQFLINSAGHNAPKLAREFDYYQGRICPKYGKGHYVKLNKASPFSTLIYPVPEPNGLGIHATLNLDGTLKFGPDFEWVQTLDISSDDLHLDKFYTQIARYWPAIKSQSLTHDYAGVRPRVTFDGLLIDDFKIDIDVDHGVPRLINLLGIESPGLTSSLSIAEMITSHALEIRQ